MKKIMFAEKLKYLFRHIVMGLVCLNPLLNVHATDNVQITFMTTEHSSTCSVSSSVRDTCGDNEQVKLAEGFQVETSVSAAGMMNYSWQPTSKSARHANIVQWVLPLFTKAVTISRIESGRISEINRVAKRLNIKTGDQQMSSSPCYQKQKVMMENPSWKVSPYLKEEAKAVVDRVLKFDRSDTITGKRQDAD